MNEPIDETFNEQIRTVKERAISFRVSDAEYEKIDESASRDGETPNGWSRKVVLSESQDGFGMTANERILLEEMGVLRKLMGVILKRMLSPEEMGELREIVEECYPEYGRKLLDKRRAKRTERESEEEME